MKRQKQTRANFDCESNPSKFSNNMVPDLKANIDGLTLAFGEKMARIGSLLTLLPSIFSFPEDQAKLACRKFSGPGEYTHQSLNFQYVVHLSERLGLFDSVYV